MNVILSKSARLAFVVSSCLDADLEIKAPALTFDKETFEYFFSEDFGCVGVSVLVTTGSGLEVATLENTSSCFTVATSFLVSA